MSCRSALLYCLVLSLGPAWAAAEPVPLFPNSDFEAGTLVNWTASGTAFTRQPTYGDNTLARGNVPAGQQGNYWIGTFENYDGITGVPGATRGDGPVGTLTSQPFVIQKRYITFLMGGGNHPATTGVKLVCEGTEYPMATGFDSESMIPVSFDAQALVGKTATLVIFDQATGGWGHINADNFQGSDEPAPSSFRFMPGIPRADSPAIGYDQQHRPQFHFTSRRNWLNDPNGMVFDGEKYHLFFQHNPLGTGWGNMTWGHATSTDMIHWRQKDHALLPYQIEGRSGTIFSGSAVVDHNNSLGVQTSSRKTLAAFYTYAHSSFYQALAYSTDGGVTWDYHDEGRAVVPYQGFDAGERDPKVFWHEASQKWVMLLWVQSGPGRIRFFTSTDLKEWTFASDLMRDWAFECMDMFPLPVDGNPAQTKWVIYDASFDYEIGSFDGTQFVTEAGPFKASHGSFYAAQSFNQAPGGRVVQVGWMNGGPDSSAAYGVPFNQQMSFPCDLTLRTTPAGVRLCANPIPEISALVTSTHETTGQVLDATNLLAAAGPLDLVDLSIEFSPGTATQVVIDLPRTTVRYNVANSTFTFTDVNGNAGTLFDGAVEPRAGRVKLRLLLDRLSLEAYAFDGEKFGSHYLNPNNGTSTPSIHASGGQGTVHALAVKKLASAWTPETPLSKVLANPGFEEGIPSGATYQGTIPGWTAFGDWAGAAGRWDDSGNALTEAAGYPDFTGVGAASLKARNAAGENRAGIYQSLGHVALADIGKTFTLGADLGARITDGPGNYAHTGELTVSFRKGVTSGVPGDAGTLLGTAGTRTVTADDVALPSLAGVAPVRSTAVFTPGIEDVGTEVFAVIDLKNISASTSAMDGEKHYIADNVTLSAVAPPLPAGPLAYEGFDYAAGAASVTGRDGGHGWAGPWVTVDSGSADLLAGSLAGATRTPAGYDALSTGGRCHLPNGRRVGRFLDTSPGGPFGARGLVDGNGRIGKDGSTLYLSFLQQPDGTSYFYEFEFHRGGLGDNGRIAGIGNDRTGNNVHLRAPNNTHTLMGAGDTNVNFYVVRIDFKAGNDDVRIYRNPTSATEPGEPTLTRLDAADMSFDGISFGAFVNGRTVAHDEIRLGTSWAEVIAEKPYITWTRASGLEAAGAGSASFDADPDHDGVPNGIEWLLGGSPLGFDGSALWTAEAADGLTISFDLDPEASAHTSLVLQWSTGLAEGTWTDVPIQPGGGTYPGGVVVTTSGDTVTVHVPGYHADNGKLFARLRAVEE
ncbi:glycoside hydrolase family 32 protein [Luteolibacter flavescens]|uniref:Glycoside hydrolase family 32 protein n=1 Tax=Luteolibacter flavescens TaxID=1859460 RepID=A0ABT3FVQ1_9BACT|nr:glycoside hydrolase family 32 protein [Luteolibacter flavescens]MCW1887640.1 glycoside hydrolase family 32 protein [Luteolibacter flavescens]